MKFESKYGLGEICVYNEEVSRGERYIEDLLVKVIAVNFEIGNTPNYIVEIVTKSNGIQRLPVHESSLTGDPDFNQESGYKE